MSGQRRSLAQKTSAVPAPHVFTADPHTPGDPVSGDGVCRTCRLVGRPGDAHHNMPEPTPDPRSGGD